MAPPALVSYFFAFTERYVYSLNWNYQQVDFYAHKAARCRDQPAGIQEASEPEQVKGLEWLKDLPETSVLHL